MQNATMSKMMSEKKEFVIRFRDGTFYSKNVRWKGVELKSKATWLTRQDADRTRSHLNQRKIDMGAVIIPKDED